MSKIEVLPGLRSIIEDYMEKAKTAAEDVKLVLLEKHGSLSKEVDIFKQKYGKLQVEAQEASIQAIEAYRRSAKQLLKQAPRTRAARRRTASRQRSGGSCCTTLRGSPRNCTTN